MRYNVLLRSVQRLLNPGEQLYGAAFMWQRHRLGYLYSIGAFVALTIIAIAAGFDDWLNRIVIGVAGASVALTATTLYRVLAATSEGLVLIEGGRIRHVGKTILRRLEPGITVEIKRDTLVTTDWNVDGTEYTVPKSSQQAMQQIAAIAQAEAG